MTLSPCLWIIAFITTDIIKAATINVKNKIINTTDESFQSFTLDQAEIVTDSQPKVDFSNEQFIYLAQQLSPSYWRVGGTVSDYVYYKVGSENPCHLPSDEYHCLSMNIFEDILKFAENIKTKLVFGLSFGYPTYPSKSTTEWNSTNTRQLLEYLKNKGYNEHNIYGFELGNELDGSQKLPNPIIQSNAFKTLRNIINEIWGKNNTFKLLGPDPYGSVLRSDNEAAFDWIINFVEETCSVLDCVTYHCYINQNETAMLTPNGLNEQYRESVRISNIWNDKRMKNKSFHCKDMVHNIWAGEIAGNGNGGLSGHAVFARQQIARASYGLMNAEYEPYPDYYTAYLWNKLMSNKVIYIESNVEELRVYAHCTRDGTNNGVTVVYINLYNNDVVIGYDGTQLGKGNVYLYSLTATESGNLHSTSMSLNDQELKLNNGKLPSMGGKLIDTVETVTVQKLSYGFIQFESTAISVCG
eukprot:369451_1